MAEAIFHDKRIVDDRLEMDVEISFEELIYIIQGANKRILSIHSLTDIIEDAYIKKFIYLPLKHKIIFTFRERCNKKGVTKKWTAMIVKIMTLKKMPTFHLI